MTDHAQYTPGPAAGAQVQKGDDKWTLILTRDLRHAPEKVWLAITDPEQLREWAPFDVDVNLGKVGTANLTWVGMPRTLPTSVTRADPPSLLEYGDLRWKLESTAGGTRLTLWHSIDRRFIAWGAAGWHICIDVLDRLVGGAPTGRIVGPDALRFDWQRLNAEYAQQFGIESPAFPQSSPQKS